LQAENLKEEHGHGSNKMEKKLPVLTGGESGVRVIRRRTAGQVLKGSRQILLKIGLLATSDDNFMEGNM